MFFPKHKLVVFSQSKLNFKNRVFSRKLPPTVKGTLGPNVNDRPE